MSETEPRRRAPEGLSIRPEDTRDHAAVRDLVARAFVEEPTVADLVSLLRHDSAGEEGHSYVAEIGGEVVGHVMMTRAWVDALPRLVRVLVLSPLSVAPEWQSRGIGGSLVEYALAEAGGGDHPLVFLEGSPLYYTRFGFQRASRLGFVAPSRRIPDPAFQVVTLPAYEVWMTGALVYPDVFWRLDAVGLRGEQLEEAGTAMGEGAEAAPG